MNKHILAVQQRQDNIQEHIDEDITLADLTPAEYIAKNVIGLFVKTIFLSIFGVMVYI